MAGAAVCGLVGAVGGLLTTVNATRLFPWPALESGVVGLDPLSAFFLVPVFLLGGLGSLYGLAYWPQRRHPGNGRKLRACWGILVAGMALLLISRHALIFLLGWEAMALAAYFLIAAEDQHAESRQAAWIYFIATHVSTLTLLALFALWRHATGSYDLVLGATAVLEGGQANWLFVLALVGFGIKAGVMPLHFWLPGAHASAPSHVSAMMSGVVLKMGVYGLVRWSALLPDPPALWGATFITLGAVSGLLGVVFAIGQHDLKRLLAYHSVENIGIILMGLGVALLGRTYDRPVWVVLGMAGCLLHVWNHSLFKSLLFFCAGAVIHHTGTRQLDRMGGLAKEMPQTAALFLVGAVAICGLPPLNGFVSEWFIYLGMLRTAIPEAPAGMGALLGVPVLAMIGALAVACFVKVFGIAFLGEPRTAAAARVREAPLAMRSAMIVLAACCVLIGLVPITVAPVLDAATAAWFVDAAAPRLAAVAPLPLLGVLAAALSLAIAGVAILGRRQVAKARRGPTWDCGYARPTPRMQYTATSFAQMIVALFRSVLRPHTVRPQVNGLFPPSTHTQSHIDDTVLHRVLLPAGERIARSFDWFRGFHRGLTHHYLLYILLAVIALFVWAALGA